MRLALWGSGKIVQELLTFADDVPGLSVVAILGRASSRPHLEGLAREHGIASVYTDLDECLADPEIDTVYVGLPNDLHYGAARAALDAGKHVICEKPFTDTVAELDDLAAVARDKELILVEAISTMHLAAYQALRAHVAQVGRVRLVESTYTQRSSRYDAFRAGDVHASFDGARGGGALRDLGVYPVHAVVGLLGAPDEVTYYPVVERGVDTSGIGVLSYPATQAVIVCAKDSGGPSRTVVHGDQGVLVLDGAPNYGGEVTLTRPDGSVEQVAPAPSGHRMVDEFVEFVRMVDERDTHARDRWLDHSRAAQVTVARLTGSAEL